MNVCEEFRIHKQRRRGVVRGVPYPGGVGGPATRPGPYCSYLRLAFIFFQGYEKLRVDMEIFRKNIGDFFGDVRGFPL